MTHTFKKGIDRPQWVQVAPAPNAHAAGSSVCSDLRPAPYRDPFVYHLVNATVLNRFNVVQKAWNFVQSPALAGTFGAGAGCVFAPSRGLNGAIAAGSTTTLIVTSTVLTSVGANMLANRGGSGEYGFRLRVIDNGAGGSGKTEERWIIANSSGTTPSFLLDSALTFTPVTGSSYEVLCGQVFMLGAGVIAAGTWKSLEVATNTLTSRSQTNLPATIGTDSALVALDEQYVPYDLEPGEGFLVGAGTYNNGALNCLTATAIGASSITGQAASGDAAVVANEYRNFQIRIVEDTVNVTAVGQRRMIASHTAGASPVYTLGTAWTVNPSANAKFVIEYPNLILCRTTAAATTYTYNYSGATVNNGTNSIAADAWSTAYFAASGSAMGAGHLMMPSFGIRPDTTKYSRHSNIFCLRGGGVATLDVLDIAGGTTGSWTNGAVMDGAVTVTTGATGSYGPWDEEGRMHYLNIYTASAINQMFRFDVQNRVLSPITPTDWIQSGTAVVGSRIATYCALDGTDKVSIAFLLVHLSTIANEMVIEV